MANNSGRSAGASQHLNKKIKKQAPTGAKEITMKKRSIFFGLAAMLAMVFLAACSDMPTIPTVPDDNTPGIKLSQGGKNVDSLLVNIWAAFSVNTSGSSPVSYLWNFGDGTATVNTTFAQTEHRYVSTGNFTVSVQVGYSNGGSHTYTRQVRVYQPVVPPSNDVLVLLSSSQESSGKWTYRLGLSTSAYSGGSGANPFITGQPGGVVITNPVAGYDWVQLVNQQENGRLIVVITCWNQSDIFLNYGGNFISGQPASQWNWANIEDSAYYIAETGGGNLHFSLSSGQLLPVGGTVSQLPGLLGDDDPATLRMTVEQDSLKFFCNLDRLPNFDGGAWLEFQSPNGDLNRQILQASVFFSGWGEATLSLAILADNPFKVRYGHNLNDLADMTASKYWVPADGWMEFYLLPINGGKGGWEVRPTR
jgi:hypothetical protein